MSGWTAGPRAWSGIAVTDLRETKPLVPIGGVAPPPLVTEQRGQPSLLSSVGGSWGIGLMQGDTPGAQRQSARSELAIANGKLAPWSQTANLWLVHGF